MGSWTKQMGFPVISVRDITQEESGSIFTLSQQKFSPNPASRLSFAGANWQVPLSFSKRSSSPNEGFHKVLMDQEVMTVRLEHRSADWVKVIYIHRVLAAISLNYSDPSDTFSLNTFFKD